MIFLRSSKNREPDYSFPWDAICCLALIVLIAGAFGCVAVALLVALVVVLL